MSHENEAQTLRDLGLTLLQAKVYLALVRLTNPTAGETAKLSKVARQEVYRIIDELFEVGLVSKIVATPIRFRPLPLSEGISVLLERRIKKTSELQVKIRKLLHKNNDKTKTAEPEHYEFTIVSENTPWFTIRSNLEKVQTVDFLTSIERFSLCLYHDEEAFRKAAKEGVKIRVLAEKPPSHSLMASFNALREYPNFKFRYTLAPFQVALCTVDQKKVLLALTPSKRAGPPYLVSNHPSFVHLSQHYFETMWNKAKE